MVIIQVLHPCYKGGEYSTEELGKLKARLRRGKLVKAEAYLYFFGLCYEIIKHNQYEVLHKVELNMDKTVKLDTAQRLEQLL